MSGKILTIKKIGENIRRERTDRMIKQETLAKQVKLSKSEISRIEHGKREIKISTLLEIAKALGVNPEVLLNTNEIG